MSSTAFNRSSLRFPSFGRLNPVKDMHYIQLAVATLMMVLGVTLVIMSATNSVQIRTYQALVVSIGAIMLTAGFAMVLTDRRNRHSIRFLMIAVVMIAAGPLVMVSNMFIPNITYYYLGGLFLGIAIAMVSFTAVFIVYHHGAHNATDTETAYEENITPMDRRSAI